MSYLRVTHEDKIDVSLLMGKTRTAPTNLMSTPRLELQAVVLASRLFELIKGFLELVVYTVIFWSDSHR